jgi:hypothetical protein
MVNALMTSDLPPSPGVAFSALLIAAGTVGFGGALGAIFAAGDVVNEDRKLRSIQGFWLSLDWYANNTAAIDSVITKSVLVNGGMMDDI